jgi:aminoglycoside phosphotransferase (APT) family kinase protein
VTVNVGIAGQLADGDQVTVLDWSTALLAPRAHDVAFTSLLLSEPPLRVPGWQRPLVRILGRVLTRRFIRGYQRETTTTIEPGELKSSVTSIKPVDNHTRFRLYGFYLILIEHYFLNRA